MRWQSYIELKRHSYHTVVGNLQIQEKVWSPQLNNHRDIFVYLPRSYAHSHHHYPVIYMHDGQNLFDQASSYAGEWRVDETMEQLSEEHIEGIVVGIPNMGGQRIAEYSPFHDLYHGAGRGDGYVTFIADTLKPMIDHDFRTLPGREQTGIMGSSMGGLISLFAFFSRPETFGLAGIMSPSFWFANQAIFNYIEHAPFHPGKIYLDAGTREYGGASSRDRSRHYYGSVRRMKRILVKKGYRLRKSLKHVEEKWAGHNEPAWARRLPDAFRFLLT